MNTCDNCPQIPRPEWTIPDNKRNVNIPVVLLPHFGVVANAIHNACAGKITENEGTVQILAYMEKVFPPMPKIIKELPAGSKHAGPVDLIPASESPAPSYRELDITSICTEGTTTPVIVRYFVTAKGKSAHIDHNGRKLHFSVKSGNPSHLANITEFWRKAKTLGIDPYYIATLIVENK